MATRQTERDRRHLQRSVLSPSLLTELDRIWDEHRATQQAEAEAPAEVDADDVDERDAVRVVRKQRLYAGVLL